MKYASYYPKYYVDNDNPSTFANKGDVWEDHKIWLAYIRQNETKNNHFDPITYMFGIIQQVQIECKKTTSLHNDKVISRKYLIEPNIKINLIKKPFNGMQQLLDDYFGLDKNPEIVDFNPCGIPSYKYTNIIPCGKYILINIINYEWDYITNTPKNKDKTFKITPPDVNEFKNKTLNIKVNSKDYKLRSFTCHQGANTGGGHYINYKNVALDLNDAGWQYISDSTVNNQTVTDLFNYFTSTASGTEAWENYSPVFLMYELVDSSSFDMETVDTYNTNWFNTRNWINQTLSNNTNKAVGFNNSVNGCFFNATIQMLFANRHLATLILNSDAYPGIKLNP